MCVKEINGKISSNLMKNLKSSIVSLLSEHLVDVSLGEKKPKE